MWPTSTIRAKALSTTCSTGYRRRSSFSLPESGREIHPPACHPPKKESRGRKNMVMITHDPIDPSAAYGMIAKEHAGSIVFHYATVKDQFCHDTATTEI